MLTRQAGSACNWPARDSTHALLCRSAAHVSFLSYHEPARRPGLPDRLLLTALANEHLALALSLLHRFLLPYPQSETDEFPSYEALAKEVGLPVNRVIHYLRLSRLPGGPATPGGGPASGGSQQQAHGPWLYGASMKVGGRERWREEGSGGGMGAARQQGNVPAATPQPADTRGHAMHTS